MEFPPLPPHNNLTQPHAVCMHAFRLMTVLELMFEDDTELFFAMDGVDGGGGKIECEWTVGAMVREAEERSARAAQEE